jgi:glutaredoxin|tara:strand:+ start:1001 stop:1276 length:276 start_codon:yes stop_codon:yes gene_type:complete
MKITAYTTSGCFYCIQLKELFKRANLEYELVECHDVDPLFVENYKQFKKDYPDVGGYPFVVIDGERIGGIVETAKFLKEKGLVSSRKNERT